MDNDMREQHHAGRRAMVDAFAKLTTLAWRAGVDPELTGPLHGRFFDGNVEVKDAFTVTEFLADIRWCGL